MLLIQQPSMQWVNPSKNVPVFGGSMYFGLPNTDPKILANRIEVYYFDQLGNQQVLPQPVKLSDSGVPTYLGAPVEVYSNSTCSIRVDDRQGFELYLIEEYALRSSEVVGVDSLKSLPTADFAAGQYSVTGFYAGSTIGGGVFIWDASRSKADHNGGTVITPEALTAWDGTQADLATMLDWVGAGSGCYVKQGVELIDFYTFGAVDNAVIDISIEAALAEMSRTALPIIQYSGYFKASRTISHVGAVDFDTIGATIEFLDGRIEFHNAENEHQEIVSYTNTFLSFVDRPDIEVAGVRGCKIYLTDGDHGFEVNDVIKVMSPDVYPWIRSTFVAKKGEFGCVINVVDNEVWIDKQLETGYTTITKLNQVKCKIHGQFINKQEDTKLSIDMCNIRSYVNVDIKLLSLESFYTLCYIGGCFGGTVNITAANFRNFDPDSARFGYGVVDQNCEGIQFNIYCKQIRHGYTTTHGGTSTGQHAYGQPRYSTITGQGISCITPFDTHVSGDSLTFLNCYSLYSIGSGFSNRSAKTAYINCHTVGNGDTGFFIFNAEPIGVVEGRLGLITFQGCSAKLHRRAIRADYTNAEDEKYNAAFRYNIAVNNCNFDLNVFSDAFLLRNTTANISITSVTNMDPASSVMPETATEENPVNLRAFFDLKNCDVNLNNVSLTVDTATNIVPFKVETDRTLDATADTIVQADDLELNSEAFNSFASLVYSGLMQGQFGTYDYVTGLDYTFLNIDNLKLKTKIISTIMQNDVAAHYTSSSADRVAGCVITAKNVIRNSPRLNGSGSFEGLSFQNPADNLTPNYALNLNNVYLQHLFVRLIPTNYGGAGTATITVNSITNSAGRMAQGMILEFVNAASAGTTGLIVISAPEVSASSGSIPAGESYKMFFDGALWRPFV